MTLKISENPPTCFPENLFSAQELPTPENRWWVARTKSRQEKALAWSLKSLGIDYFLPLVPRPQKCKGRMRTSIVPLFNGYLFFRGSRQQRLAALRTSRISQVLEVEPQEQLSNELSSLALATQQQANLKLHDFMQKGKPVKIITGPFTGFTGVIKERKNKKRIILNIKAIRQAVEVEIDIDRTTLLTPP